MSFNTKEAEAAAEQIFVSMLGSTYAEANIKQFASAVEKLGYDWDAQMLRDVFDRIDHSGDGNIDLSEFKQGITLVAGAQLFKEMDADGNGTIERREFINACRKINPKFSKVRADQTFTEVDTDKGGTLDLLEFLDAMNTMHNGQSGGLMELGFEQELGRKMGDLKKKIVQAEKRMKELEGSLKDRELEKNSAEYEQREALRAAQEKQRAVDAMKAELAPKKVNLERLKGKLGPIRTQLEENMQEYGAKRSELDEAFQEQEYDKIHPLSNDLLALKRSIADLEGQLGITQEEHDSLMEEFTQLGASHGVNAEELAKLHSGVENAQGRLEAAMAAHADDLEAWKATSSEYKTLKRDLLTCQVKEKKGQICNTLGELNKMLAQHRRATKKIKELCEQFQAAEDNDDFETTGTIGDKLVAAQALLDEADKERVRLADELKRLRALLSEEKKGLAALDR